MSEENVEVVRRVVQRFVESDFAGALEDIDPEATLDWSNSDAPDRGIYTGHTAWGGFALARDEALAGRGFDLAELVVSGPDTVVLAGRMREHGRASGVEVGAEGAAVFTLRRGKVTSLKLYQTRGEALKAVGLG